MGRDVAMRAEWAAMAGDFTITKDDQAWRDHGLLSRPEVPSSSACSLTTSRAIPRTGGPGGGSGHGRGDAAALADPDRRGPRRRGAGPRRQQIRRLPPPWRPEILER